MSRWFLPIVLLWAICGIAQAGVFHDPALNWRTIESDHFRIHYYDGEAALAQRFWPKAETVYNDTCAYLNWYPRDKTDVVLTDEYDLSNGFTSVFPYNSINLFVAAPDDINSLEDYDDWLALVFRHEFLHVVHLDKVRGAPRAFQRVFGRHPLLFPNAYQPRWVIEGLATYAETDTEKGVGRGQSAFYEMLMRAESISGFKPIRRVNQPIYSWPAGDTPYLYGVFFFEFVHDRYGEQAIKQMVENYSSNIIPFRINSNSTSVFQKELPQMWDEYQAWRKQKDLAVVAKVEQAGVREGSNLTQEGYDAGPLQTLGDKIFFYQFTGEAHAAIKMIQGNAPAKKLLEVNRGTRFSLHKDNGLLITQPEICRNARIYYDIYRAKADGSQLERLTHCGRDRYAIWSGKGDQIIAVHNELGNNSLQLLNAKAEVIETLWRGKFEEQIGQITSSEFQPYIVATVWRPGLGWNLEKFDLQNKQWTALTQDHAIETQPQFSPDGQRILYSSDQDGIYNIYEYDLNTGKTARLTNLIGGAFYPALANDRLAYIGYSARGFDVYAMNTPEPQPVGLTGEDGENKEANADKEKIVGTTAAGPVSAATSPPPGVTAASTDNSSVNSPQQSTNADASASPATLPSRPYSPWSSLAPTWWTPYLQLDNQRTELGLSTAGNDVLKRHLYATTLAYDVKNKQPVGSIDYVYDGLWPVFHIGYTRDNNYYVNSNNDVVRIRADDQGILEMILPFLAFDQSIFLHAAVIDQVDSDVWTNGVTPWADSRNNLVGVAARYVSTKKYPLSVSRSDGRDVRLIYEDSSLYGDSDYQGQVTVGDWREFIPLGKEHVLALRAVEGLAANNPSPFVLGGIQSPNNVLSTITNGEVEPLFNVRNYSLRGYSEGQPLLTGKNMQLFSAEYRFPIDRIEHGWMAPPFGFNQIHGAVFYDIGGVWDTGSSPPHHYAGAGFELDADLDLFYNIPINTTLGYAKGFDKTIGENIVYVRIGAQF